MANHSHEKANFVEDGEKDFVLQLTDSSDIENDEEYNCEELNIDNVQPVVSRMSLVYFCSDDYYRPNKNNAKQSNDSSSEYHTELNSLLNPTMINIKPHQQENELTDDSLSVDFKCTSSDNSMQLKPSKFAEMMTKPRNCKQRANGGAESSQDSTNLPKGSSNKRQQERYKESNSSEQDANNFLDSLQSSRTNELNHNQGVQQSNMRILEQRHEITFDKWLAMKKKEHAAREAERRVKEQQLNAAVEERCRLSAKKYNEWLVAKRRESRVKEHTEMDTRRGKHTTVSPEEAQRRVQQWEHRKAEELHRRREELRDQHKAYHAMVEQRKLQAQEAWERWIARADGRSMQRNSAEQISYRSMPATSLFSIQTDNNLRRLNRRHLRRIKSTNFSGQRNLSSNSQLRLRQQRYYLVHRNQ